MNVWTWPTYAHSCTLVWKADCKKKIQCAGTKGEVGLPDPTVVLYVSVNAALSHTLSNWSSNSQTYPTLSVRPSAPASLTWNLETGHVDMSRDTIMVMCRVLLQGWGRNWICQDGIKVQLEYLIPISFSLPHIDQCEFLIMWQGIWGSVWCNQRLM